ncbi:MAG: hypothetical protein AAFQ68_08500, partial [Bacteroidota bacterium]
MKNILLNTLLAFALIALTINLQAQETATARLQKAAQVEETNATFSKKLKPSGNALTFVIEGNAEEILTVLNEKFSVATGEKVKKVKDLQSLESVVFEEISPRTMDYYYRVEPVENTADKFTRITLFLSSGYYNFIDSEKYPEEMANATAFLQSLDLKTKMYQLEQKIAVQQEAVAEQQKMQDELIAKQEKLKKEVAASQNDITKMEADIAKLQEKIAATQTSIGELETAQGENTSKQEAQATKISEEVAKLQKLQAELEAMK